MKDKIIVGTKAFGPIGSCQKHFNFIFEIIVDDFGRLESMTF